MNKRGVTVQAVIISIIILLISAAIIFYFFRILPYREIIAKQACHQSVIWRSEEIVGLKPGQLLRTPLNCKTQELEIDTVNEALIKRELANAMYDCWWMLGEGERNFFARGWTKNTYCVLCSRIKFSEAVQERLQEVKGLDSYLAETKIPKKNITYAEYFTTEKAPQVMREETLILNTEKEYAITYALIERTAAPERAAGIAGAAAVVYFTRGMGMGMSGTGLLRGGLVLGAYAAGSWAAQQVHNWIIGTESDYYVAFGVIPLEAEAIKSFGCERIESIP